MVGIKTLRIILILMTAMLLAEVNAHSYSKDRGLGNSKIYDTLRRETLNEKKRLMNEAVIIRKEREKTLHPFVSNGAVMVKNTEEASEEGTQSENEDDIISTDSSVKQKTEDINKDAKNEEPSIPLFSHIFNKTKRNAPKEIAGENTSQNRTESVEKYINQNSSNIIVSLIMLFGLISGMVFALRYLRARKR